MAKVKPSTTSARSGIAQQRATTPQPKATPGSGISEQRPQPMTNAGATNPRPMSAAQHAHFASLVGHALDASDYNGHGHAVGRQGKRGHDMVASDANKQGGSFIPQGFARDVPQNRQSQTSKSGGPFDDPDAANYGSVDDK